MKLKTPPKKHVFHVSRITFWFLIGASLSAFLIASFSFILFQKTYDDLVYPGVSINGVDFSKKNKDEVRNYFSDRNENIQNTTFVFKDKENTATVSARDIDYGFDESLMAEQAISIGRTRDPLSNLSLIIQSYFTGINLRPAYRLDSEKLKISLAPVISNVDKTPVDALFQFSGGRVTAFRPSSNGQAVDVPQAEKNILDKAPEILASQKVGLITVPLPVRTIEPEITTDKVNNLGIKEQIGFGTSLFQHSIPERIFNVTLASSRVNGVLVPPGETFSFNKALGDVSSFTGYKQAYVIQNGRTVLGDGGGVCQVSTTFFRAILDAGLPIVERTAHAYRVGYYEQDSAPGVDATIYVPSVDLKFKNDTGHHILAQTVVDPVNLRLSVYFYGTADGRKTTIAPPVITSQSPAPAPLYQDDPTLPSGTVKQVDFAAPGANVYFTRTIVKDGKSSTEKFTSNYRPWQAVFLKGTK